MIILLHQCNQSLYFLREDNRRATRRPPVHPNEFSKRVKTYTFTNNSDSDFVDGKYRTTYGDIVGFTKKVDYSDIPLALGDDWKLFLHQVLRDCNFLVEVNLSNNENIEGATLEPFKAAAGTLEVLDLINCPGFEGSLEPLRSCRKLRRSSWRVACSWRAPWSPSRLSRAC